MKKIKIHLLLVALFGGINYSPVMANSPTEPASNTSCSSAILTCDVASGHSFDNNTGDIPCGQSYVNLYYFFYTTGGNMSFQIDYTGGDDMENYQLYGPMPSNLIDACEQLNSNAAQLLSSNLTPANTYNVTVTSNPTQGLYMLVIKMDVCESGTISFDPRNGNYACEPNVPCENCIPSFELEPGKPYMISAWTKEANPDPEKTSYNQPQIQLSFPSVSSTPLVFSPSGVIIDGWQRIEAEFTVPTGATDLQLQLVVLSGEAYFDDIRIFPFDGSMKSYVYDPVTLRLMAELDERNFATFYEYDEEGKLVRVKKETERGVMTIQENKTFIKK